MAAEALTSAWPRPRKKMPPRQSRLDPFKPTIDQMLWADLSAPRKQRHTVRRIFNRLVTEQEMEGDEDKPADWLADKICPVEMSRDRLRSALAAIRLARWGGRRSR
jgi:hypothetical protein